MILWSLSILLLLKRSLGQQGDHLLRQNTLCQKDTPTGEFGFYFDGDEIFYVDQDSKEVVYRLPEFEKAFSFEAQAGLQSIALCQYNLDVFMKGTKGKSGPKVPPMVKVYPAQSVDLGKPNTLICSMDGFFPPVLNVSWSKNDNPVEEGVQITDFYPGEDSAFERFAYLTFIPDQGDIYSCTVEHPALDTPDTVFWAPKVPSAEENKTSPFSIRSKPRGHTASLRGTESQVFRALQDTQKASILSGVYLLQQISDCLYKNDGQDVVLLYRVIYNKEEQLYFDSRVGKFIGITEFGKFQAEYWNNDTAYLAQLRASVDTYCRHNYELMKTSVLDRKVSPTVTVQPFRIVKEKHPNLLICATNGFYPQNINVTLLKNGEEVTHDISSSGVISNGDWTYQIILLMEFIPKRADVYSCKVEHSSLKEPLIVDWKYPAAQPSN